MAVFIIWPQNLPIPDDFRPLYDNSSEAKARCAAHREAAYSSQSDLIINQHQGTIDPDRGRYLPLELVEKILLENVPSSSMIKLNRCRSFEWCPDPTVNARGFFVDELLAEYNSALPLSKTIQSRLFEAALSFNSWRFGDLSIFLRAINSWRLFRPDALELVTSVTLLVDILGWFRPSNAEDILDIIDHLSSFKNLEEINVKFYTTQLSRREEPLHADRVLDVANIGDYHRIHSRLRRLGIAKAYVSGLSSMFNERHIEELMKLQPDEGGVIWSQQLM